MKLSHKKIVDLMQDGYWIDLSGYRQVWLRKHNSIAVVRRSTLDEMKKLGILVVDTSGYTSRLVLASAKPPKLRRRSHHWFVCQKCGEPRRTRTDGSPHTPCRVCRDRSCDYHYHGYGATLQEAKSNTS